MIREIAWFFASHTLVVAFWWTSSTGRSCIKSEILYNVRIGRKFHHWAVGFVES
jgi:hypothetical protein